MSADNWTRCPRCLRQAWVVFENLKIQVDAAYGNVPVEEFDKKRANLASEKEILEGENTFRTFREDYSFYGAEDGVVTVHYSGSCSKCKLAMKIKQEHPIPGL